MATVSDVVNRFRQEVDDAELPGAGDDADSLWKTDEVLRYLDLAHKEFARETRLLRDSSSALTTLVPEPASAWLSLSRRIIKIVRATGPQGGKMALKEFHEMDAGVVGDDYGVSLTTQWESTQGVPRVLITDMEQDKLRLYPIPAPLATLTLTTTLSGTETSVVVDETPPSDTPASGYLRILLDSGSYLMQAYTSRSGSTFTIPSTSYATVNATSGNTVYLANAWTISLMIDRLPLYDIDGLNDSAYLEFTDPEHIEAIVAYMKHRAYLKQDADTYDKDLSDRMLRDFLLLAAKHKRDASRVRTRVGSVRYGGL